MATNDTTKRDPAPYPVGSLNAKTISGTQLAAIIAYVRKYGDTGTQTVLATDITSKDYADLILVYEAVSQGGQATVPPSSAVTTTKTPNNWEADIVDFYNKLTSGAFWLRVAEVLIGLLLVGIGLEKVSNITIPGPVGSVIHSGKG